MKMLTGIKLINSAHFCTDCACAKQFERLYKKSICKSTYPFEFFYADFFRPVCSVFRDGESYFLLFTCNYTDYMWIFTSKKRKNFYKLFKELIRKTEQLKQQCYFLHVNNA
jgi:hypothetical protein